MAIKLPVPQFSYLSGEVNESSSTICCHLSNWRMDVETLGTGTELYKCQMLSWSFTHDILIGILRGKVGDRSFLDNRG